jgi:hypothetical protein
MLLHQKYIVLLWKKNYEQNILFITSLYLPKKAVTTRFFDGKYDQRKILSFSSQKNLLQLLGWEPDKS